MAVTLKICKLCDEQKATNCPQIEAVGIVNKKKSKGSVCLYYAGKMICGWKPITKV